MKIIFCLPGNNFSNKYFMSWNNTIELLKKNKIEVIISNAYNPVVAMTRNSILVANFWEKNSYVQKPFGEKIKYDYLFWIDNDIVWKPEQVINLIEHQKDIVSGCYVTIDNKNYPICKKMEEKDLFETGNYRLMNRSDLEKEKHLFEVDFVGFGFIAIKYGVFESMNYPWFEIPTRTIGNIRDITSEDVHWCIKAKEKKYKIYVDPNCIVGHQKNITLI